MKKPATITLLLMLSSIMMAQVSIINGKLEGYKPTDTISVYIQGQNAIDTIKLDKKGTFTISADIKEMTEAMLFLTGRGGEGREHSCCILMQSGKTCNVKLSMSKPNAKGKIKLLTTFSGEDPAMQTYANQFYNIFSISNTLNAEELVKQKSYADCRKYLISIFAPLRETISKIKDNDFVKIANRAMDSQQNNALLNYAIESEKVGKKMESDKDFMNFVNSINKNDTLEADKIASYLQWYQQAHGDKYLPLTGEAAQLKYLGEYIQNKDVRNKVADSYIKTVFFYATFGMSTSAVEFKDLYEQYLKVSTDTTYVKFVNEQLKKIASSAAGKQAVNFALSDINDKNYEFKNMVGNGVVTYIDFWATWCGPCKREIPFLAKMVEYFKYNKKVRIISVSIDEDHNAWKKMVADDKPAWEQYIIPDITNSAAIKDYDISSIPRFMLYDTDGKLYKGSAPRPSEEETKVLIESLIK